MKKTTSKISKATAIQSGAMETETISKNRANPKSHTSRRNFFTKACLVFLATGIIFSACNKDREYDDSVLETNVLDKKITVVVENGNDYNTLIKRAAALGSIYDENNGWFHEIIASANYANGGFALTLPGLPENRFFIALDRWWDDSDINFSDNNAKLTEIIYITALTSSTGEFNQDDHFTDFVFIKYSGNSFTQAFPIYSDRDVDITGTSTDMSLKKGWNWVYYIETLSNGEWQEILSTQTVSGLKWYTTSDANELWREWYQNLDQNLLGSRKTTSRPNIKVKNLGLKK